VNTTTLTISTEQAADALRNLLHVHRALAAGEDMLRHLARSEQAVQEAETKLVALRQDIANAQHELATIDPAGVRQAAQQEAEAIVRAAVEKVTTYEQNVMSKLAQAEARSKAVLDDLAEQTAALQERLAAGERMVSATEAKLARLRAELKG
jgi:chromosome segregation ATPase